jgi:hypothetical protein
VKCMVTGFWPWDLDAWNTSSMKQYRSSSIPITWTGKKVSLWASHGSISCKPWKNASPSLRKSDFTWIWPSLSPCQDPSTLFLWDQPRISPFQGQPICLAPTSTLLLVQYTTLPFIYC